VTADRRALGAAGEELVAAWYVAQGYEVVARNWRCREGELDVVARRGDVVVFCEVKSRSSDAFGAPVEAVGPAKQRRLRVLGSRWLADTGTRAGTIRFDVASVLAGVVEVFEDAL
jgi:putative endonuclease